VFSDLGELRAASGLGFGDGAVREFFTEKLASFCAPVGCGFVNACRVDLLLDFDRAAFASPGL